MEIQFYAHEMARKTGQKFEYHLRVTNGSSEEDAAVVEHQSQSGRRAKKSLARKTLSGKGNMKKEEEARLTIIHPISLVHNL